MGNMVEIDDLLYINENVIVSIELCRMKENEYYNLVPARYVRKKLFGIIPYGPKNIFVDWHFKYDMFNKITRDNICECRNLIIDEARKKLFVKPYVSIKYNKYETINLRFDSDELAEKYLTSLRRKLRDINLIHIKR